MKKLTLSLCAVVAFGSAAFAGTATYSKDSKQVAPAPCPQWYADSEFNLGIMGAYAFTGTEYRNDTYFGVDHAWGGAIDAKYFFHKYFGLGVEGNIFSVRDRTVLNNGFLRLGNNDDRHAIGEFLGTFTFRFPIACSRFAPYFWAGGGGIFGGGRAHDFYLDPTQPFGIVRRDFNQSTTRAVGQFGGGFEVRFTPHIGLLNDFSWNVVSGSRNNFGMARTGLNFAF